VWQTDRQTDGRTDRQNYDSQDCPRICSRSKNGVSVVKTAQWTQCDICTCWNMKYFFENSNYFGCLYSVGSLNTDFIFGRFLGLIDELHQNNFWWPWPTFVTDTHLKENFEKAISRILLLLQRRYRAQSYSSECS